MPVPREVISLGQIQIRFLLDGDDTEGRMCVFEFVVPPNARVPAPHSHLHVDEALYVLEGTLTWMMDGAETDLAPGTSTFVPRGIVHGFRNPHAETARVLATLSPASIGPAYFRELAALLSAGGPPDPARVSEIMARHGLQTVPPPA
jgi:quercetin dioxygenase-like cupin family protein